MSGGSPVGNALANSQQQTPMGGGASPLNTGGGMSGGQTQMPNFAGPQQPFALTQAMGQPNAGSQFNAAQNPGANQFKVPDWVQAPEPGTMSTQAFTELTNPATGEKFMAPSGGYSVRQQPDNFSLAHGPNTFEGQQTVGHFGDMQYRPQRYDPIAAEKNYYARMAQQYQQPQPMRNPFQPIEPSYLQDPEYQGYETQARDLGRQMDEYMKKAPMYQQLQELQGKMSPFQQRHQQQEMQRMQQMQAMQQRQFQQPSPFRRGQFQQPAGIQGLMGMLGGRGGMQQPRMTMDMPYARGFASELPTYLMKKGGKV